MGTMNLMRVRRVFSAANTMASTTTTASATRAGVTSCRRGSGGRDGVDTPSS